MRLRDFQVFSERRLDEAAHQLGEGGRDLVCRTGVVSESVRLALRRVRPEAQAVKLLVVLDVGTTGAAPSLTRDAHLQIDICSVTVAVDPAAMLQGPGVSAMVDATRIGVDSASSFIGEGYGLIHQLLDATVQSTPPCNHPFEALAKIHRSSGASFSVWFRADVGCRFWVAVDRHLDGVTTEFVVFESKNITYVEDDFPMKRSAIQGDEFLIYDKASSIVARVPLA